MIWTPNGNNGIFEGTPEEIFALIHLIQEDSAHPENHDLLMSFISSMERKG